MTFTRQAAVLRHQEILRLRDTLVPRIEQLQAMTPIQFRSVISGMLERFGHTIVCEQGSSNLLTSKHGDKFLIACSNRPSIAELSRLHDGVIEANAQRGFFITARDIPPDAAKYAETAPIDLIDGKRLIKILHQSRKGVLMPQTYQAMCQECGDIVEHRLDRDQDEARPCSSGHLVAPTIARAALIAPRVSKPPASDKPRIYTRREIKAHNHKLKMRG